MNCPVLADGVDADGRLSKTLLACGIGVLAFGLACATARGDVLVSSVQSVSTGPAVVEQTFTATTAEAGPVDVTVTDTAFPAALKSVRVAVTDGITVVGSAASNGGTPAALTLTFTATAGTAYVVRVLGGPDPAVGSGFATVTIGASGGHGMPYASFPAVFQIPLKSSALLPDRAVAFPAAGNYTVTLTDLALPRPLQALTAAFFQGSNLVGAPLQPGQTTLAVPAAGTYKLTIIAAADPTAKAGLFGLRIVDSNGAVVYPNAADPTGVTSIGFDVNSTDVVNTTAGPVTLTVTDLQFPSALASLGAVVTAGGALIARQCPVACGAAADQPTGVAPAGKLQLWQYAAGSASSGSYLLDVSAGPSSVYSISKAVDAAPVPGTNGGAYTFPFTVNATGTYTARVTDLAAPADLQSIQFAVYQNGALVGPQATTAGSITFPATAGQAKLVVIAQAPTGGSGLFGAEILTTGTTPTNVLATTQAVGRFSGTQLLPVIQAQAGRYDLTLTDAAWPAKFQPLNVFITSGAQIVGKVYGGGTLPLDLPAGNYVLTFSAVPDAAEGAGLYGISVQSSVPTVTLSADATSINSGQGVHLDWSSTGASTCTASGGWTGTQATSGTHVAFGPLTATTTFTLTCSGPGGESKPASVSVTVTVPPSSGGGGDLGAGGLAALLLLGLARGAGRRRA